MSAQDTIFNSNKYVLRCRHGSLDLSVPAVMGILNVTPDSFYDGGRYTHEEAILIRAEQMLEEGASIIDIGAMSTRPGSRPVSEQEELARLLPAIKAVRKLYPSVLISADTYRSIVARKAIDAGADIINDIAGGNGDAGMFAIAGKMQVPYILMHISGNPETMHQVPSYPDIVTEVTNYFIDKINLLKEQGVEQIVLDPGLGFGKTLEGNFALLAGTDLICALGRPVLVGLSRKSMINKVLGTKPEDSLNGTIAANTIALMKGASIIRVHDVKEASEAVKLVSALKRNSAGL